MAKISTQMGPSDSNQPGEPLHLLQADVVPGSQPEKANEATTQAVADAVEEFSPSADGGFLSPEEESVREDDEELDGDDLDEDDEDDDESDLTPDEKNDRMVAELGGQNATPPVVTSTAPYDPSAHSVKDVNEYLDSLERDSDEYNRVLDVESGLGGKGRLGILNGRV